MLVIYKFQLRPDFTFNLCWTKALMLKLLSYNETDGVSPRSTLEQPLFYLYVLFFYPPNYISLSSDTLRAFGELQLCRDSGGVDVPLEPCQAGRLRASRPDALIKVTQVRAAVTRLSDWRQLGQGTGRSGTQAEREGARARERDGSLRVTQCYGGWQGGPLGEGLTSQTISRGITQPRTSTAGTGRQAGPPFPGKKKEKKNSTPRLGFSWERERTTCSHRLMRPSSRGFGGKYHTKQHKRIPALA